MKYSGRYGIEGDLYTPPPPPSSPPSLSLPSLSLDFVRFDFGAKEDLSVSAPRPVRFSLSFAGGRGCAKNPSKRGEGGGGTGLRFFPLRNGTL